MSTVGGHLHIFRVVRTTHRNVKRVNRILLQVTERVEPLSCDEMQLQLGCDSGEPQYEPVLLARAVRVAVLRANGCSAGIGVVTAELWPGWPRGVRNLQAMACTSRHSRGYSRRLGCRQCSCRTPSERPWVPRSLPWFEVTVDTG